MMSIEYVPGMSLLAVGAAGALFGVGGAAHCAGMCGGFPLSLSTLPGGLGVRARRVALYNFGRGFTYVFLACLAGVAGLLIRDGSGLGEYGTWGARGLSILVGIAILLTGLWLLGVPLPLWSRIKSSFIAEQIALFGRSLTRNRSPFAPLALGLLNGLLPCPLVYVMLMAAFYAAARFQNPWVAPVVGLGFAIGTMPIMMSLGMFGAAVSAGARRKLLRVAAVLMLAVGLLTIARGIPFLEPYLHFGHEHHHESPAVAQAETAWK
ncbi:MAG: sulfite exporter TauE/SafE family protein [Planctomycetes bacterium]|nr:sulfite exporter TauE/SafE family protein [Planctomycetota bacterium]